MRFRIKYTIDNHNNNNKTALSDSEGLERAVERRQQEVAWTMPPI